MKQSYFAFGDPLAWLDRKLHPYRHQALTELNGHEIAVSWTRRADQAMSLRDTPLRAEMQLYFSCVVKKRVLFHDADDGLDFTPVNTQLAIAFRPVEASSCDPVAFAANHPERREMSATGAAKMRAKRLFVDFRQGRWLGEFEV